MLVTGYPRKCLKRSFSENDRFGDASLVSEAFPMTRSPRETDLTMSHAH